MTNVEAAIGCAQLENLDMFVEAKRRIDARYRDGFANQPFVSPFPQPDYAESACWFSGVVLDHRLAAKGAEIRSKLREAGIDARPFWRPMHFQTPFAAAPRTRVEVADDIWQRVLTLPCSTHLRADEQDYVIDSLRALLRAA
jgi:dTDP-4-amino-4,6-dideoxygalactose transaminase